MIVWLVQNTVMIATFSIVVLATVIFINGFALYLGHDNREPFHKIATFFGGAGLLSLVCLLVTSLDGFTQIWVMRPGHEGRPMFWFFCASVATTLGSMAVLVSTTLRDYRASKQVARVKTKSEPGT